MKLAELAYATGSTVSQGDPDLEIVSAAGLDIAGAGDVTFLANPKYTPQVAKTLASAIFLKDGEDAGRDDIAVLRAVDPYVAYTQALRAFFPEKPLVAGVHPTAVIDETATVGD